MMTIRRKTRLMREFEKAFSKPALTPGGLDTREYQKWKRFRARQNHIGKINPNDVLLEIQGIDEKIQGLQRLRRDAKRKGAAKAQLDAERAIAALRQRRLRRQGLLEDAERFGWRRKYTEEEQMENFKNTGKVRPNPFLPI